MLTKHLVLTKPSSAGPRYPSFAEGQGVAQKKDVRALTGARRLSWQTFYMSACFKEHVHRLEICDKRSFTPQ